MKNDIGSPGSQEEEMKKYGHTHLLGWSTFFLGLLLLLRVFSIRGLRNFVPVAD